MSLFLLVVLGGALGTAARFIVGVSIQAAFGPRFPAGTLSVNLIGSFLVSFLMVLGVEKGLVSTNLRIAMCTGAVGSFTAYSSFNFETLRLFQQGSPLLAFANLGLTLVGCLATGALGLLAGRLIGGA